MNWYKLATQTPIEPLMEQLYSEMYAKISEVKCLLTVQKIIDASQTDNYTPCWIRAFLAQKSNLLENYKHVRRILFNRMMEMTWTTKVENEMLNCLQNSTDFYLQSFSKQELRQMWNKTMPDTLPIENDPIAKNLNIYKKIMD